MIRNDLHEAKRPKNADIASNPNLKVQQYCGEQSISVIKQENIHCTSYQYHTTIAYTNTRLVPCREKDVDD
jgi:hypothetical protein